MDISKIIKNRRQELGLTLKDIAKALGIAESTVSRYESSDIQNMGIDKIEALSNILECSPAYLMGWEDSAKSNSRAVAAHLDAEDLTEDELEDVQNYIAFVKSKRSKS